MGRPRGYAKRVHASPRRSAHALGVLTVSGGGERPGIRSVRARPRDDPLGATRPLRSASRAVPALTSPRGSPVLAIASPPRRPRWPSPERVSKGPCRLAGVDRWRLLSFTPDAFVCVMENDARSQQASRGTTFGTRRSSFGPFGGFFSTAFRGDGRGVRRQHTRR